MKNTLQVITSKKFGQMHGYTDNNNIVYLKLGDIARCLGFIKNNGIVRLKEINRLLKKAD